MDLQFLLGIPRAFTSSTTSAGHVMQAPHRPVPSRAALHALRQLAYVASGTACGAAAIVYEERRRRIKFLKQVADNGRAIREYSRSSRRSHATAAIAAAPYDDFEDVRYSGWNAARQTHYGRSTSTARDMTRGSGGTAEYGSAELLPSNVERSYTKWRSRQDKVDERGPSRVPVEPRRRERRSRAIPEVYVPVAEKARDIARQPQGAKVARCSTAHPSQLQSGPGSPSIDDVIGHWKQGLLTSSDDGSLERSWTTLAEKLWASQEHGLGHLDEQPFSLSALAQTAIDLRLAELLAHIIRSANNKDYLRDVATDVTDAILVHPAPELFEPTIALLLHWSTNQAHSQLEEYGSIPASLQWTHIQLLLLSRPEQVRQMDDDAGHDAHTQISTTFESLLRSHSYKNQAWDELSCLFNALVTAGKPQLAVSLLTNCTTKLNVSNDHTLVMLSTMFSELVGSGHQQSVCNFIEFLRSKAVDTEPMLRSAWKAADTEEDLIDMFERFEVECVPTQKILARLLKAMINFYSADTLAAELFGARRKLWTGVLARDWQTEKRPRQALRRFWSLQRKVGSRPLDPALYDTIMKKCTGNNMDVDYALVDRHRRALLSGTNNSHLIVDILANARSGKWITMSEIISKLRLEGFDTMQPQQRVQIFDQMFAAFAKRNQKPGEMYKLAQLLCDRILAYPSPATTLRYLTMSLARNGLIDAATQVHKYVDKRFAVAHAVTPVDATDLLSSFYYGFRPSLDTLAHTIRQLSSTAWYSVSRFSLPLLAIANSYDLKYDPSEASKRKTHYMIAKALTHIDDDVFRSTLFANYQASLPSSPSVEDSAVDKEQPEKPRKGRKVLKFVSLKAPAEDQQAAETTVAKSGSSRAARSLQYERVPEPEETQTRVADVQEIEAPTGLSEADASTAAASSQPRNGETSASTTRSNGSEQPEVGQLVSKDAAIEKDGPIIEINDVAAVLEDEDGLLTFNSQEAHFQHIKTKAMMHQQSVSDDNLEEEEILALLKSASSSNPVQSSAHLLSLASSFLPSPAITASRAANQQELSPSLGSFDSLAIVRSRIAASSEQLSAQTIDSPTIAHTLRQSIDDTYTHLHTHNHPIDHALATALSRSALRLNHPSLAIDLLHHALTHPLAPLCTSTSTAPYTVLLTAYITLLHGPGIRWTVTQLITRNTRIDKPLLTAFKAGILHLSRHPDASGPRRAQLLSDLRRAFAALKLRQREQVKRARSVGAELAGYIAAFAQKPVGAEVLGVEVQKRDERGGGKARPVPVGGRREMDQVEEEELRVELGFGRGRWGGRKRELRRRLVDAVVVDAVCGDVGVVARGRKAKGKVEREGDGKEKGGIMGGEGKGRRRERREELRVQRVLERVKREREGLLGREVEVGG